MAVKGKFHNGIALVRDGKDAFALFFKKGPAKIKTLEKISESMHERAWSNWNKFKDCGKKTREQFKLRYLDESREENLKPRRYKAYSNVSFLVLSRAYEKIGKLHAEAGDYLKAHEAFHKARTDIADLPDERRERRLFGMECYYLGKHEATAGVENSTYAKAHLSPAGRSLTREDMIAFAASEMARASLPFMKGDDPKRAIEACMEAASLFAQIGESRKALEMCDRAAVYAKESDRSLDLISAYKLAAEIAPDKEMSNIYRELEKGAYDGWLREINDKANSMMLQRDGNYGIWQPVA